MRILTEEKERVEMYAAAMQFAYYRSVTTCVDEYERLGALILRQITFEQWVWAPCVEKRRPYLSQFVKECGRIRNRPARLTMETSDEIRSELQTHFRRHCVQ